MVWSSKLNFNIWVWSNKWLLRYSSSSILRSSFIGGRLHVKDLYNIVWSSKHKFKIWVGSNKGLLRYFNFNILRSSSIGGRLHLRDLHINLILKFGYDPISGCWDIPLITFSGRLPLEVVFIWRIYKIWFGHRSFSLKF